MAAGGGEQERWRRLLEGRAEHGGGHAMLILGLEMLRAAHGVPGQEARAMRWLHRAARAGHVDAQNVVGVAHSRRTLLLAVRAARPSRRPSASSPTPQTPSTGHELPLHRLTHDALRHEGGCGVEGTEVEERGCGRCVHGHAAVAWLRTAAERGSRMAAYNLGLVLRAGLGVPQQEATGLALVEHAAEEGVPHALVTLAKHARGHVGEMRRLLEAAASQGHMEAKFLLAVSYGEEAVAEAGRGSRGSGQAKAEGRLQEAVALLKDAGEGGYEAAQLLLGRWYLEGGRGVERSDREATRWYAMAAANGSAEGQAYMALCYELGDVVQEDVVRALELYEEAARKGHPEAQFSMGEYATSFEQAVKWYRKAAGQGHGRAMWKLGLCYLRGFHKPIRSWRKCRLHDRRSARLAPSRRDLRAAGEFLMQAARAGCVEAAQELASLLEHPPVPPPSLPPPAASSPAASSPAASSPALPLVAASPKSRKARS